MGAPRVGDGVLAAVQQDLDEASRLAVGAGRVRPGAHRLGSEASVHGGFAYLTGLTGGLLEGGAPAKGQRLRRRPEPVQRRVTRHPLPLAGPAQAEPRLARRPSRQTTCTLGHPPRTRTSPPAPR